MIKKFALLLVSVALTGCVGMQIDRAISKYEAVADRVELGDSKDKVLAILQPTQESESGTLFNNLIDFHSD
jgi:hypothetical protein